MKALEKKTNGDYVQPLVDRFRSRTGELVAYAREHPDEVAIAAAPLIVLTLATMRHNLTFPETVAVSQAGYWCGVLAAKQYRAWKAEPAGLTNLKRVS